MNEINMGSTYKELNKKRNGIDLPIECIFLTQPYSPPGSYKHAPHYHEYIEFLFGVEDCDVNAWVGGEWVSFGVGDLLVINSNVAHNFEFRLPKNKYICIKVLPEVIYFSENPMYDVKYVVPFLQHNLIPYRYFSKTELEGSEIPQICHLMYSNWKRQEYGYEIELKSQFLKLFLWIIRYDHTHGRVPMEQTSDISYENIQLIQRSMDFINANFADITETDAAANVNLSYSYYSKLFRRVVGKNFHDYLTTVRINEAERLLLSTDLSVTEIALTSGFATSSHFIETFRKVKHLTPKQYRMNWGK